MENEFETLYHIIPIGDGCRYLCKGPENYYLQNKAQNLERREDELVFRNLVLAICFIEEYLDNKIYTVEEFWRRKDYYETLLS